MDFWGNLVGLAASYLVGGIPFGILVCRAWKGIDPRDVGSGNIGATNVWRAIGPVGGMLVLALDVGKGWAAVRAAQLVSQRMSGLPAGAGLSVAAMVAAIIGSNWSVYLKFRGGKGGGVSLGAGFAAMPRVATVSLALWSLVLAATRLSSLATITAATGAPVAAFALREPVAIKIGALAVALFALLRHRANIGRLMRGEEPRLGASRPPGPST